jgi:hypothetical protein
MLTSDVSSDFLLKFFFLGDGKWPPLLLSVSLFAEQNDLMFAVPGGLIGVGTKVDPTLCRADRSVLINSCLLVIVGFWPLRNWYYLSNS